MKIRAIAGVLIVLVGCFVAAFPWIKATRYEYEKNIVLNRWEQLVDSRETEKIEPAKIETAKIQKLFDPLSNGAEREGYPTADESLDEEVWEEDTNAPYQVDYVLENMEGIIAIDKINLRYPLLRGATKSHLNLTVCIVAGSPEMGETGNYCIAGHRSRIYGRQFNRLTELQEGDVVNLSNSIGSFDYVVVETMLVTPEDTWVLDDTAAEKLLTLITCDYTLKPTGRFIVKCKYRTQ